MALDQVPLVSLNAPAVACQVFDGEGILIHFDRGHYFSVKGAGASMIELLQERPASAGEIGSMLALRFGLDPDYAREVAGRFLGELLAENLVVPAATEGMRPKVPNEGPPSSSPGAERFEEPSLVKYTDLEDLLVLDPIHDVMVTGWPPPAH